MTEYGPTDDDDSGVVVDIDADLEPLPDDEYVPDTVQQPPAANDTIQPQSLDHLAIVPDASSDDASSGGEEVVTKDAATPVTSRLPLPALVGLAGLVGVAGAAGTAWTLRRRRTMRQPPA